jgi:hypothetical protein
VHHNEIPYPLKGKVVTNEEQPKVTHKAPTNQRKETPQEAPKFLQTDFILASCAFLVSLLVLATR